jgi:putative ABC transport system substrate-binding protein
MIPDRLLDNFVPEALVKMLPVWVGMKRRDFLGIVSGAVVAGPIAVRAQQSERVRFIGMINALESDDPEAQARAAVFEQAL